MFNLFNKGPKVRTGKQKQEDKKPAAAVGGAQGAGQGGNAPAVGGAGKKPASRFGAVGGAWKKLNTMDRKQAYTWGAVAVVALVALLTLGSAMGSSNQDDFSDFETRGYDLANMPFSSDEAEQYLLASKYPDLKDKNAVGLYTKADKEARQAEDAENVAQLDTSSSSSASQYVPGRYYGGGSSSGGGAPTQVGSLSSANLKSASGSGISGTFGPSGDFSNFRSQEKGSDKFAPQGPGSGSARKALFQAATGSRAAAGLKNDKLLNAKKAMMGGNVKGSGAFLDDSGAVSLKDSKGLELDTNAPVSSADLGGMDDAIEDAKNEAEEDAKEADEQEWWKDLLIDVAKMVAQQALSFGMNSAQDAIAAGRAARNAEAMQWAQEQAGVDYDTIKAGWNTDVNDINSAVNANPEKLARRGVTKVDTDSGYDLRKDGKTFASYEKGADGGYSLKEGSVNSEVLGKKGVKIPERAANNANNKNWEAWTKANPDKFAEMQRRVEIAGLTAKQNAWDKTAFNRSKSSYPKGSQYGYPAGQIYPPAPEGMGGHLVPGAGPTPFWQTDKGGILQWNGTNWQDLAKDGLVGQPKN